MEIFTDNQDAPKRAYVFPGQGSQSTGMGEELYTSSPAAREIFQEADDSLGMPLSRLMFQGPAAELRETVNSQPAIMTASIAPLSITRLKVTLADGSLPHLHDLSN